MIKRQVISGALAVVALCVACGSAGGGVAYDFLLTDAPVGTGQGSDYPDIQGIVAISNTSSSDVFLTFRDNLGTAFGFDVTDMNGNLINHRAAGYLAPVVGETGISVKAQSMAYLPVSSFGWTFTDSSDQFVAPGQYRVAVVFLDGTRTSPATVTVCARTGANTPLYAICNSPCADSTLAQTPTHCGATLTCTL